MRRRPIQGSSSTTPLRPSTPVTMTSGGTLRRSLDFKSQIPIRIGFEPQSSDQQTYFRARVLERHRQATLQSSTATPSALQAIRTSSLFASRQQQPIDAAFKVYKDRLQTDLGDFRALCSRLLLQEQEEKEKWHALCLKMMKERDTARQRVNALMSERESHSESSPAVPASAKENTPSKATKREREDETSSTPVQELPSASSPVEPRPIRSLRSSPVPSASLCNSSSSPLPSTSSSEPPSPETTVSPTSTTSSKSTPCSDSSSLNIITFNPARSPNDKTSFDVFGEIDIPETRPVKRRKSYDSTSDKKTTTKDGAATSKEGSTGNEQPPPFFLIDYTDIMYIPMKGRLVCRACL